uniref:BTB domain-containing protein n=1 Tax=Bursaphelenchus xylophilus TaxID=6326 RepID=A0A1I7SA93_BURXY
MSFSRAKRHVKSRLKESLSLVLSPIYSAPAECRYLDGYLFNMEQIQYPERNLDEEIIFRYSWTLRVSQRLLQNREKAVLNVSPPFCTAYNGVQMTWLLRLYDDFLLDMEEMDLDSNSKYVHITLYYKDGPTRDISLSMGRVSIYDQDHTCVISGMNLEGLDYTKGSGWSPGCSNNKQRKEVSDFVYSKINKNIIITAELRLKFRWFQPLAYLISPAVTKTSDLLQQEGLELIKRITNGTITVPHRGFFNENTDRYAIHRQNFIFLCQELSYRFETQVQVEDVMGRLYFDGIIAKEAECFEDYVDILEAATTLNFPSLKHECERFICQEVMLESSDLSFVKKMLILAERFKLRILKMVALGVLVDRTVQNENVETMRNELLQFAVQIHGAEESSEDSSDSSSENHQVVESVVGQLEVLTKHIKEVSLDAMDMWPQVGVGPLCSPGLFPQNFLQGRRSSLKNSRENLPLDAEKGNFRRRSVMFSLPSSLNSDNGNSNTSSSCSTPSYRESRPELLESMRARSSTDSEVKEIKNLKFRYVWPVRVSLRQLSPGEATILHVSPKFATVHDHVSFQWTLKVHGSANMDREDYDNFEDLPEEDKEYVAVSLYYVDGPVSSLELLSNIESSLASDRDSVREIAKVQACRGEEVELAPANRKKLSALVKSNVGRLIRIAVTLEIKADFFKTDAYLNAVSPTPFHSFLTENYKARASSKVWRRRSRQSFKRPRSNSEGHPDCKKIDLERAFNRVMERERALEDKGNYYASDDIGKKREHLFKKLLVNCCDSCERRASLIPCLASGDDEEDSAEKAEPQEEEHEHGEDANCFECPEDDKAEIHDTLANMYFNKVALPQMEYIEDFTDFLIDAELNDLPVLKRACERYLCGELNTKREIMTSLLLDLLFISMVFNLPVMKCMTLTELSERYNELETVDKLLQKDEYKKLNERIQRISDRNLHDLIDECKKFREQRVRVQQLEE